jgi:hypothetical protein
MKRYERAWLMPRVLPAIIAAAFGRRLPAYQIVVRAEERRKWITNGTTDRVMNAS